MEVLPENRRIWGRKGLGLQVFLIGDVQVDAKHHFLLGFDVVGVAGRNKQNRMDTDGHSALGALDQGTALKPEGKGAVLPRCNDAVLGRKMELDHG